MVDDTVTTDEDVSVEIFPLANDSDPNSPPANWRVTSVGTPSHGTAVINAGLSVFFNPDPDYVGVDSFSYTMIDGDGGTASANVLITIQEADDTPIAIDDPGVGLLSVGEGETINIDVLANDLGLGDEPFTVSISAGPCFPGCASNGSAVVLGSPGPAGGISVNYTAPDDECVGEVTFEYTVTDGDLIRLAIPTRRSSP